MISDVCSFCGAGTQMLQMQIVLQNCTDFAAKHGIQMKFIIKFNCILLLSDSPVPELEYLKHCSFQQGGYINFFKTYQQFFFFFF